MRVTEGKPTFRFSRFGRSGGFGGRIRVISTCFTVYFGMRSGPPKSAPSGPGGAQGALGGRVFAGSGRIPADCYRLGGASRAPGQPDPLHLTHCSPSGKILPRGAPGGCGPISSDLGGRIRLIFACFAVHIGVPCALQIHLFGPGGGGGGGARAALGTPNPEPRPQQSALDQRRHAYVHPRTRSAPDGRGKSPCQRNRCPDMRAPRAQRLAPATKPSLASCVTLLRNLGRLSEDQ